MNKVSNLTIASLVLSVSLFAFPFSAFAVNSRALEKRATPTVSPTVSPTISVTPTPTGKTLACQAREKAITVRMDQLSKLAANMEKVFDSIATRVKTYYTNVVLPSGNTVANYDTLVNDIQLKKDAVQAALTKAQAPITAFSCTTGNPKVLMNQFRLDMQAVKSALKDYRESVNNLIVAVRTASEAKEAKESPTPTLTTTPTTTPTPTL